MRKITGKIILAGFIIMMFSSLFPRIMWDMSQRMNSGVEMNPTVFLFGGFASVFSAILLFTLFMDKVFLKRVKDLNHATGEVIKGNYDFTLEMTQNDELSELTNNFNKMVKELQSNEYLNKEFVRNISHELKTPLSAINGYAELINSADLSQEEIKKYSNIIATESKRLSLLTKDILQISLIESLSIIKQGDKFKIAEQIRNVIQLMQLDWEEKNIEFDLELEEITSISNKEITYQIWTNLISNAIKFSPNESRINIVLKSTPDHIIFTITNPGYINEMDQDKVFNLFYVSDKSNHRDSNGVGLTLASKIVNKLEGKIELLSKNGIIQFEVTLPLK